MNLWITVKEGRYYATLDTAWDCGNFRRAVRAVLKLLKEHKTVERIVFPSVRELKQWSRIENPEVHDLQQPFLDYVEERNLILTLPPGTSDQWMWPLAKVLLKKRIASKTKDNRLTVYTDGSCLGNPGYGGWGFYSKHGEGSGGDTNVTNNAMEMRAVLEALRFFRKKKPGTPLRIISDSSYVINGCSKWRHKWALRKFQGVKNGDTWKAISRELALADVEFSWVKGHSGVPGNEAADKLAGAAARLAKQKDEDE